MIKYKKLLPRFSTFGDLFYEVIHLFPVVQTQHPGFYYQQAAHYAKLRQQEVFKISKNLNVTASPTTNSANSPTINEFYGQRSWCNRPGEQPIDPLIEQEHIQQLQLQEINTINHSVSSLS